MCRLFALHAGARRTRATFWLLDAPDSLSVQSHRNPDGTGLGTFARDGDPIVHKAPLPAFADAPFATEARQETSTTFLGHIRFASTGGLTVENTHPFEQDGRLMAHNGVVAGLATDPELVHGETDSERLFAVITRSIRKHEGDIHAGLVEGARWVAANAEVYAINLILTTPTDVFAFRYPAANTLYVLDRAHGPLRSHLGTRIHAEDPVVVIASEPMDDDPGWRALDPGVLLHVGPDLCISSETVLPDAPAHPLTLDGPAENSQHR